MMNFDISVFEIFLSYIWSFLDSLWNLLFPWVHRLSEQNPSVPRRKPIEQETLPSLVVCMSPDCLRCSLYSFLLAV